VRQLYRQVLLRARTPAGTVESAY